MNSQDKNSDTELTGFLKSKWGESLTKVKNNNLVKGYEYIDTANTVNAEFHSVLAVIADFAGLPNCVLVWSFTSDKLYQGVVMFTPELSAQAMLKYHSIKDLLVKKYGEGVTYESYDYPYEEGDGHWETAFELGKGKLNTYWIFKDDNTISLQLTAELDVKITYQSDELTSETIEQKNAINSEDL